MSQTKTLKVRVALLCILVGVVLALVAVVTDHWAVLSPHVEHHNTTCGASTFSVGRVGLAHPLLASSRPSCSPFSQLSPSFAEKNCSYFRHFNPGESSEIFEVTTQKEYSISAAAIAIFSLGFIIVGTLCALLSFRKKRDYLLRPASMFYIFAAPGAQLSEPPAPLCFLVTRHPLLGFRQTRQALFNWPTVSAERAGGTGLESGPFDSSSHGTGVNRTVVKP
nr:PREDICTED: voltage-dependent calcium channel gamma-1 subunit [Bos mutus]